MASTKPTHIVEYRKLTDLKELDGNPPYGREIGKWVKKCAEHYGVAVMLIPARTDTRWWHEYIANNPTASVRFIKGRLKFGDAKNCAPFPSAIVIFFNTTLDEWGGVN